MASACPRPRQKDRPRSGLAATGRGTGQTFEKYKEEKNIVFYPVERLQHVLAHLHTALHAGSSGVVETGAVVVVSSVDIRLLILAPLQSGPRPAPNHLNVGKSTKTQHFTHERRVLEHTTVSVESISSFWLELVPGGSRHGAARPSAVGPVVATAPPLAVRGFEGLGTARGGTSRCARCAC